MDGSEVGEYEVDRLPLIYLQAAGAGQWLLVTEVDRGARA